MSSGSHTHGSHRDMGRLCVAGIITGALVGVLGTAFRYSLGAAFALRLRFLGHLTGIVGALVAVVVVAAAAAIARYLVVRFAPLAAGSGVQHVEAVMRGEAQPAGLEVIPVKFVGGVLAIGAGLALGREGPTVQMGSAIGTAVARHIVRDPMKTPLVEAAGAGAGLAVAFNAPIGGAMFVFEELTQRFSPPLVMATLCAGATAVAVMRSLLGDAPDFYSGLAQTQPIALLPAALALGALLGLVGAFYNGLTMGFLAVTDRLRQMDSVLRAAIIGGMIGLLGWAAPNLVGGGEVWTQQLLSGGIKLDAIALFFLARLAIGPLCYAAGTPGGLFAPLLAVGAAGGALFAGLANAAMPLHSLSPVGFAVLGMAALFTAVVRAPMTGVVLTAEMTGRTDLVLAMLVACFGATLVTTLLESVPIYDSLRERMLADPHTRSQIAV
jgi:CIC family chloride channel protein